MSELLDVLNRRKFVLSGRKHLLQRES
ncbi:uncharacterized protein METZ01_LOCUS258452 [marine metagenome]|uniref:Uncharacterized protein n=1 Tax=marine metagenome TaxID=408172 RepID=A0A382J1B4_9ZZZZ